VTVHSSVYCFSHSKCLVCLLLLDDALQPATLFIDVAVSKPLQEFGPHDDDDDHVLELRD